MWSKWSMEGWEENESPPFSIPVATPLEVLLSSPSLSRCLCSCFLNVAAFLIFSASGVPLWSSFDLFRFWIAMTSEFFSLFSERYFCALAATDIATILFSKFNNSVSKMLLPNHCYIFRTKKKYPISKIICDSVTWHWCNDNYFRRRKKKEGFLHWVASIKFHIKYKNWSNNAWILKQK